MSKIVLLNLESVPYRKIEIVYNNNEFVFEVKEFIGKTENSLKKIKSHVSAYLYNLKKIIYEKRTDGFYDFTNFYESDSEIEFIQDNVFNFLIKCPSYSSVLHTTKYLDSSKLSVEISLDVNENDFSIYEDIKETYKYFIENQNKLIHDIKLSFWKEFKNDLKFYSRIEKEILLSQNVSMEREMESKTISKLLDEANKAKNLIDKIKVLDYALEIQSIEFDRLNIDDPSNGLFGYDPIGTKYGGICFYFSYLLDKEHGKDFRIKNGIVS